MLPSDVPVSFKYGAEAIALVGIAYGLIKWVGRNLRSLYSDRGLEASRLAELSAAVPEATVDALVRQGLISRQDLEAMTPRERSLLISTAGQRLGAKQATGATRRMTPISTGAVGTPMRTSAGGPGERGATPPRLHLITPTRPPLGMAVHCPGCGVPLDREALQRFGRTSCPRCKRPVSAHIQRGRLTVIVEETADEAEHRRRVEETR